MGWCDEAQIAMIKKKIKVRDLCEQTGYTRQHINCIIRRRYDPLPKGATTTICKILGIEPPEW